MSIERSEVEKAIHRSQHCQRNWDLSKEIPPEDMDLLTVAISQCPSKQNLAFYRAHFITNREVIETLHQFTDGFVIDYTTQASTTNPQVLANLVVVFEEVPFDKPSDPMRNQQTWEVSNGKASSNTEFILERDRNMAVGIAAGYLNLTANLLGYATGCCACFDETKVREFLHLENRPLLLMGIGFKSAEIGRRVHHLNPSFVFPTKPKQPISVSVIS